MIIKTVELSAASLNLLTSSIRSESLIPKEISSQINFFSHLQCLRESTNKS